MNPGLVWAAVIIAVFALALGGRQVFWGKPRGWQGAILIVVVGASGLFLALAVAVFLTLGFACDWGRRPCL